MHFKFLALRANQYTPAGVDLLVPAVLKVGFPFHRYRGNVYATNCSVNVTISVPIPGIQLNLGIRVLRLDTQTEQIC